MSTIMKDFVHAVVTKATEPTNYETVLVTKFVDNLIYNPKKLKVRKIDTLDFANDFDGVIKSSMHVVYDLSYKGEFLNDLLSVPNLELEDVYSNLPLQEGDRVIDSHDDVYIVEAV